MTVKEVLLPPSLPVARMSVVYEDRTAASESPVTGDIQTSEIYGSRRRRVRLEFQNLSSRLRTMQIFKGFVGSMQGRSSRVWLQDPSYVLAGSFPTSELLANNDFSSGTSGWSTEYCTIAASDGVLRLTNTKAGGALGFAVKQTSISVTQYMPYALRGFAKHPPRSGISGGTNLEGATNYSSSPDGMKVQSAVVNATSTSAVYPVVSDSSGNTSLAGDLAELHYSSLSRCALVDNGPNALTYSDQIDNAAWTKTRCSISADAAVSADGTTTMDFVQEDSSAATTHFFSQGVTVSSSVHDVVFSIEVAPLTRSWVMLVMYENTGGTPSYAYFNVGIGAQAKGTVTQSGNWSNARSFIKDLGNNRCACVIVARKTNAATSVSCQLRIATGDLGDTYTGDGVSGLYVRRGSFSASSVPVRMAQTITTATTGTSQTGTTIYVKGLPVSTSGLAKIGDQVQIGRFTRILTASLDSDAAGLGTLQLDEPIYPPPSDNDAVIFHNPMGRYMLAATNYGYEIEPGLFANASMEFVEA